MTPEQLAVLREDEREWLKYTYPDDDLRVTLTRLADERLKAEQLSGDLREIAKDYTEAKQRIAELESAEKERRDLFWPATTDIDQLIYEIRNGRSRRYVATCVAQIQQMAAEAALKEASNGK